MFGEKDLVFLGACMMLGGEASKTGLNYIDDYEMYKSIEKAQCVFDKIFGSNKGDDKMILD